MRASHAILSTLTTMNRGMTQPKGFKARGCKIQRLQISISRRNEIKKCVHFVHHLGRSYVCYRIVMRYLTPLPVVVILRVREVQVQVLIVKVYLRVSYWVKYVIHRYQGVSHLCLPLFILVSGPILIHFLVSLILLLVSLILWVLCLVVN